MSDHQKPWLQPPPSGSPWPSQEAADKAMGKVIPPTNASPTPDPVDPTADPSSNQTSNQASTSDLSPVESDIAHVARTLVKTGCDTLVVIGLNPAGEVVSLFRPGTEPNPFALVGALEMMKFRVISTIDQPEGDANGR